MLTVEELVALARKAIIAGNLDEAKKYTDQAKALKEIDAMALSDAESGKINALEAKVKELETFKATIIKSPALTPGGTVVDVVEDETDKKAKQPWKSLGEQLGAIYVAATKPFQTDDRLKAQKAVLGASEGVPSDGGYLIQPNFADIVFSLEHATSEIIQRVRRFPVGPNNNGLTINAVDETSRATGSRWGGIHTYWAAEGDTATASKPKFRQIKLELTKLLAFMYATDELLQDVSQLEAIANSAVREDLTWMAENAFVRGTGAGQPRGILNETALVTVNKETGQTAATLVFENIIAMWARMWSRSRANAIWMINQDIEPQLYAMSLAIGTGGVPVYLPPGGLSASPYGTLMGRPVIPVEYASTLGTVGDITLADWSQYLSIDKGGAQQASSMHVAFLTDQMCFRWTYRVDGQLGWRSALTPANGSNTQSPVVALQTRS